MFVLTHLVWPGPEGAGVEGGRLHARHQRGHIPHQVTLQSGEHRQVTLQRAVHRQCYPATSSTSSRLPYHEQCIVQVTVHTNDTIKRISPKLAAASPTNSASGK